MASSDNSFNTIPATCDTSEPQLSNRYELSIIARACKRSPVGKNLPDAFMSTFGRGHGGDVARIAQQGYTSTGWDPYYLPDTPRTPADIVNLGYVINVIEDTGDRREALVKAWELTRKVLLVAAQVTLADTNRVVGK